MISKLDTINPVLAYWGKARPDHDSASAAWHPLAYHNLDVAAVLHVLLQRDARLASRFDGLGLPFLLALHDIGKFSRAFQAKRPDLFQAAFGKAPVLSAGTLRHDVLGPGIMERLSDVWKPARPIRPLLQAVLWHHGMPRTPPSVDLIDRGMSIDDLEAARVYLQAIVDAFEPPAPRDARERSAIKIASWDVAGFATLCDWIGSNETWFPYHPPTLSPKAYWDDVAVPRAEQAVDVAGILPSAVSAPAGVAVFLPPAARPTPLQALAETIALADGPQLFVVEDLTGAGKTEAAFTLAHRLMAAGLGSGLFVAMPTMATAEALYERTATLYRALYEEAANASLILSHGRRGLNRDFIASIVDPDQRARDDTYGQTSETTARADCARWLADDRRRAFLADVGVGTIDQALLGVLPSKFQSLRLHGLAGRVLILDEVHAYDAYVQEELFALLRFHAALGGNAILLSATLPTPMRRRLLTAFADGLGIAVPEAEPSAGYPLMTHFSAAGSVEHRVDAVSRLRRTVRTHRHDDVEAACTSILAHARAGRAVCWIRNSVDDAIEAHQRLAAELDHPPLLFHARFTAGDRLAIEAELRETFGPGGTEADRAGRVVIATQVAEQSLDVDFDAMVSDAAPIDLLLQRAGRLRRHHRPARPLDLDDQGPVLEVLGPEPVDDADRDWLTRLLPRAAAVYRDHGRIWLTLRLLAQGQLTQGHGFRAPEDLRHLIDAVYADDAAEAVPLGLHDRMLRAEGDSRAEGGIGRANVLDLSKGYVPGGGRWEDDAMIPTRLGEPQSLLRLAVRDGGRLVPWAARADAAEPESERWRAWRMSEVQVRQSLITAEVASVDAVAAQTLAAQARSDWAARDDAVLLIVLDPEGGASAGAEGAGRAEDTRVWRGRALDGKRREVVVTYTPASGLWVERLD
ncbi:MAG: CRISPR-associated helicase Cas3' [Alphaproteobacteria bacterium]|nr:CRISPR-associated helicase Cas3' [Alphaproteobacteria bacterium]